MTLDATWRTVDEDRPLLDLLPELPDDERFAFVMGEEGIVAWGVAARIAVGTGPDRFMRAREEVASIAGGTDMPTFASFTFDAEEDSSVVVIPQGAFQRRDGVTRLMTIGGAQPLGLRGHERPDGEDRPRYAGSTVDDSDWLEAVAAAIDRIHAGDLVKTVLARDLRLWSKQDFDTSRVLRELAAHFPSCRTFLVDHLIGASPELLLERSGATIRSRVLAGSTPRGADEAADAELGAALLASVKDRHEHRIALRSAVDALAPHCDVLETPDVPSLVKLENIQHLGSDVTGTLTRNATGSVPHILELLSHLHPTAAVGGEPRERAITSIRELEGMSRGRYAGPVGWFTPAGDGEFAIALRCAEIHGSRARLFAGAGIVEGSLPEDELTETWLKLRAMMNVLNP